MKRIATTTFAVLASAMLLVSCKNSEGTTTTAEGTTIEDDANGNVGNSDVTTSPGTNVDQTTPNSAGNTGAVGSSTTGGAAGTGGTTNDTVPRSGQPQNSNDTRTGDQR